MQTIRTELEGFEQLFGRYLSDNVDQASIDWQEIQPPPEGTVREHFLKYHFHFLLFRLFHIKNYLKRMLMMPKIY